MNIKIGDTVWFHDHQGVRSGEVIAIIEKPFGSAKIACVKCRDEFKSLEIDSRWMYETVHDCTLAVAQKKQQDAARLLMEAAELFKKAGGMKEDVEVTAG